MCSKYCESDVEHAQKMSGPTFTVFRSSAVPLETWRDLEGVREESDEKEPKRGFFEITSVESSKRPSSADSPTHTELAALHLRKISSYERAHCKITDYRVPLIDAHDFLERDFELLDINSRTLFVFSGASLESEVASAQIGVQPQNVSQQNTQERMCTNTRFTVKPHKSVTSMTSEAVEEIKRAAENITQNTNQMNRITAQNHSQIINQNKTTQCSNVITQQTNQFINQQNIGLINQLNAQNRNHQTSQNLNQSVTTPVNQQNIPNQIQNQNVNQNIAQKMDQNLSQKTVQNIPQQNLVQQISQQNVPQQIPQKIDQNINQNVSQQNVPQKVINPIASETSKILEDLQKNSENKNVIEIGKRVENVTTKVHENIQTNPQINQTTIAQNQNVAVNNQTVKLQENKQGNVNNQTVLAGNIQGNLQSNSSGNQTKTQDQNISQQIPKTTEVSGPTGLAGNSQNNDIAKNNIKTENKQIPTTDANQIIYIPKTEHFTITPTQRNHELSRLSSLPPSVDSYNLRAHPMTAGQIGAQIHQQNTDFGQFATVPNSSAVSPFPNTSEALGLPPLLKNAAFSAVNQNQTSNPGNTQNIIHINNNSLSCNAANTPALNTNYINSVNPNINAAGNTATPANTTALNTSFYNTTQNMNLNAAVIYTTGNTANAANIQPLITSYNNTLNANLNTAGNTVRNAENIHNTNIRQINKQSDEDLIKLVGNSNFENLEKNKIENPADNNQIAAPKDLLKTITTTNNKDIQLEQIFSTTAPTIASEFPSKKSRTILDIDLIAQLDLLNASKDAFNIASQSAAGSNNEIYHRSLEKVTRATFSTVSMLSNQMSNMSDHVLELNSLVVHLKAENERLQKELTTATNSIKNQPKKIYNIIEGEENNIYLTFEIIPGVLKCVNITKILSLEELNVIRNSRK